MIAVVVKTGETIDVIDVFRLKIHTANGIRMINEVIHVASTQRYRRYGAVHRASDLFIAVGGRGSFSNLLERNPESKYDFSTAVQDNAIQL